MYHLPYYKETDHQVLIHFMKAHPFAMLIGCDDAIPVATQIPFIIEERDKKIILKGHFMRNTDHHKAFENNTAALCVFTGPHSFVSASWYSNPAIASTWNYISVHARGEMKFMDDPGLLSLLEELTDQYEPAQSKASFKNIPKDYVDKLSKAIIGFEIEVEELDNVFKLSQNRNEQDYENIIEQLANGDANAQDIATAMDQRKEKLFAENHSPTEQ